MSKKTMTDHFLNAYYKGQRIRRWKYVVIALAALVMGIFFGRVLVDVTPSPIEVVIFPSILSELSLLIGISRRPEFIIPFWFVLGILVAGAVIIAEQS